MATPKETLRRESSGRHVTSLTERRLVWGVCAASGIVGAFADGQPTGTDVVDIIYRALLAAAIAFITSYARRWSWLLLAAATATAGAENAMSLLFGLAALVVAIPTSMFLGRRRVYGAAVGGLAAQALLRLGDYGFTGSSALVVAAILTPVVISGRRAAPARVRVKTRWAALGAVAIAGLFSGLALVAALGARSDVEEGIDLAEAGLDALRDGDDERAARLLSEAGDFFSSANDSIDAPWAIAGRLVPFVGHQARALGLLTDSAADVTATAAEVTDSIELDALRPSNGRFDLALVADYEPRVARVVDALRDAADTIDDVDSPWLLSPITDRLGEIETEIDDNLPDVERIAETIRLTPSLLGGEGERTYLVVFVTPSELRGLGGFIGAFGELTAIDGQLVLTRSGRPDELNAVLRETGATLSGPEDYLVSYARFTPEQFFQDLSFSPDFPDVAEVIEELYPQAGGKELDGVISMDPEVLAALLDITGPVEVGGERLTESNAAEYLLFDQYAALEDRFDDAERQDDLDEALREVFTQLLSIEVPSPRVLSDLLGPVVDEDRLMLHSVHPDEQALFVAAGLDGAHPTVDGQDLIAVAAQNGSQSKVDYFLERRITYDVGIEATGRIEALVTVEVTNNAPSEGLSSAIIGSNDRFFPAGLNKTRLEVFTPLDLEFATIDGLQSVVGTSTENGHNVFWTTLRVGAGETMTFELRLAGAVDLSDGFYDLVVSPQPTVNPDRYTVIARRLDNGDLEPAGGFEARGPELVADFDASGDVTLRAALR